MLAITAFTRRNFRLGIRLLNAWLEKVQVALIFLHSACARLTLKLTIWLFALIDLNGG